MTEFNLDAFNEVQVATKRPVVIPGFILKLRELLNKDLNVLTESDKAFIRARVSYLSPTQKEIYKDIFEETKPKEVKVEVKVEENSPVKIPNEEITYRQLQATAKAKGLKYVGVSRDQLEKVLMKNA